MNQVYLTTEGQGLWICPNINALATITNESETQVILYPNPASDWVKLEVANQNVQSIKIYNLTGLLVQENTEAEFSVSSLAAGVYVVEAKTDGGSFKQKLVKR